MALSPYKSPESPFNRSRSSSCSSPLRNRIVYQEIYSVGLNTLVRSYSCDQVFNKDETGRTFQTTQIQISSFITPEKTTNGVSVKMQPEKPKPPLMRTQTKPNPKAKPRRIMKKIMYTLVSVVSAYLLYLCLDFRNCSYVWDLERTKAELIDNIFGQSGAIVKMVSVLKEVNKTNDFHVMILSGGVGVGKTFSSSIISRNSLCRYNQLIPHSEYFNSHVEKLLTGQLSHCGCNLITIDDLSPKIITEPINLVKVLSNKIKPTDKLLLILIYQVHDEQERKYVIEQFKNAFVNFYHVPFKPLTRDVVEKCFNFEMEKYGVVIPRNELDKLIDEKLKYNEVTKGPVGCKGVVDDILGYFNKNQQCYIN